MKIEKLNKARTLFPVGTKVQWGELDGSKNKGTVVGYDCEDGPNGHLYVSVNQKKGGKRSFMVVDENVNLNLEKQ